eukprot:1179868-Prorocentrum_minimum.AAC.1
MWRTCGEVGIVHFMTRASVFLCAHSPQRSPCTGYPAPLQATDEALRPAWNELHPSPKHGSQCYTVGRQSQHWDPSLKHLDGRSANSELAKSVKTQLAVI